MCLKATARTEINEEVDGQTALTLGIKNDARAFVRQLFVVGVSANGSLSRCVSPILVALEEVSKLSIDDIYSPMGESLPIDPDSPTKQRQQFLLDCIKWLINNKADMMPAGKSVLKLGLDTLQIDVVRDMIQSGADVNFGYPLAHCLEYILSFRVSQETKDIMEVFATVDVARNGRVSTHYMMQQLPHRFPERALENLCDLASHVCHWLETAQPPAQPPSTPPLQEEACRTTPRCAVQ